MPPPIAARVAGALQRGLLLTLDVRVNIIWKSHPPIAEKLLQPPATVAHKGAFSVRLGTLSDLFARRRNFAMRKLVQSAAVCFVACQASLCNGATFTSFDAFQAATQNLTLENFDLAPWPGAQQAGLDGTTNFGIAWTAFGSLWSVTGFSRSGPTSITDSDQSNDADDPHDNITATIGISGVNAFGGFVRAFDGRVTMTAFDGGNVVLGSVQASLASDFTFVGITSDVEIARVEFVARGPVDDFALDDVHFSQIPEPSSAMLAALGLVGLAAFGWRRRKR